MKTPMQIMAHQPQVGRRFRNPIHTWNNRFLPWQMAPCLIAPVLPGETLKNAVGQARVVSDPVANRLIGWWHEFYLYYVPLLSMGDETFQEHMKDMLLVPGFDAQAAGITSNVANADTGFNGRNQIDWTLLALQAVQKADFLNQNEIDSGFAPTINGLPAAAVNSKNWTDSVLAASEMQEHDFDVDDGSDDVLQASEVDFAMQQYELLKMHGMVDMSYEDYLRSFGVRGAVTREEKKPEPELIRYVRDFSYPANTVDAQGNVNSALSWSMSVRADKDRFFRHPGFIVGFEVARPKIYMSGITGQAAHALMGLADWLPAVLRDDPLTSLKPFAHGEGPLAAGPDDGSAGNQGYYVDLRDLLLYGDQMHTSGSAYTTALPRADLERRFATLTEAYALFSEAEPGTAKTDLNHIEVDGVCNFGILGAETDHTATRTEFTPPSP